VNGWSGIDNQGNAFIEFVADMSSGRWTNTAESIRARRGERSTKRANDFGKNRMRADSNRDCTEASSHNVRNNLTFRQNYRERARPKLAR